jgi:mevalonate kinase
MAHKSYSASVPGSMMLLGEHAVLAGKPAIVCAVQKRLTVELIPDNSSIIKINDTKLGACEQDILNLHITPPFTFVLSAISKFKEQINTGFTLNINSEFSSVMGLGSSAAVTAATVAVLANWLNAQPLSKIELFNIAKQAILDIQIVGSGSDLAASIFGGVLYYRVDPPEFIPLSMIPDLTAIYCGYKTPTPEVINIVSARQKKHPALFAEIFSAMHSCVQNAVIAIKHNDWQTLGQIFNQHQELQQSLGTSNTFLDSLTDQLRAQAEILGAKISGSGLGDCIIGLGKLPANIFPQDKQQQQQSILQIPISIEPRGLSCANH